MAKLEGGCLCGSVRYTCDEEPLVTAICNCRHCQLQTGTAFSVVVGVKKGSIKFTHGQPTVYEDTGESGLPVHRKFCNKCGSPICTDVKATPEIDWIKQGTLDNTSLATPMISVYMDSAQHWVKLDESIAKFSKMPPPA